MVAILGILAYIITCSISIQDAHLPENRLRYRLPTTHQKKHGQVFTPAPLADRLIQLLGGRDKHWLELGVGTGRIADACLRLARPASYFGVEKDRALLSQCKSKDLDGLIQADVLDPARLSHVLGDARFSRTAGNPPYGCAALTPAAQQRLKELCPGIQIVKGWAHLDLYFVLESLSRLQRPGEAAFIVSAALAEDVRMMPFRKILVENATQVECYALPEGVFGNEAQVQSYVLIARFSRRRGGATVTVGRLAGNNFAIAEERTISADAAIAHLDLGYHKFLDLNNTLRDKSGTRTLGELGVQIVRGSRSRLQFVELEIPHFHTSDFPRDGGRVKFDNARVSDFQLACAGDILVPRVGTRCLDRHAIVTDGCRPYTEAVYRLRLPIDQSKRVAAWIGSDAGTEWRLSAAKGACAKHLTVSALMQMPVPAR